MPCSNVPVRNPANPPAPESCVGFSDQLFVDDESGDCRYLRTFLHADCTTTLQILGPDLTPTGETEMATNLRPYTPLPAGETCAEAQITVYQHVGDDTDISVTALTEAALAALAVATTFNFSGKAPVTVTAADLSKITINAMACGVDDANGDEVVLDYFTVNDQQLSSYEDDEAGGVDLAANIQVPTGGAALVAFCFKKCLTKAELAALP